MYKKGLFFLIFVLLFSLWGLTSFAKGLCGTPLFYEAKLQFLADNPDYKPSRKWKQREILFVSVMR